MSECTAIERRFLDLLYVTGSLTLSGDISIGEESLITQEDIQMNLKEFWPR
ncbi:hypothetical protein [Leptospira bouyouniensis]|uniref:hypothetical protein n=1 Tax=Leptospira bouyouniensis TaxID=2484911 RepID=UPI00142DCE84|nr:hypothetical protein [Leptospira bouyouniensis]